VLKPFVKHFQQPQGKQIEGFLKPFPVDNRILPREVKVVNLRQSPDLLSFVKS
jgi:hypothetical protein